MIDLGDWNELLQPVFESEEYKKMTESEKIEAIKALLSSLSKQGLVKNIYFDKSNAIFSFECKNGAGRAIMIRGFNPNYD